MTIVIVTLLLVALLLVDALTRAALIEYTDDLGELHADHHRTYWWCCNGADSTVNHGWLAGARLVGQGGVQPISVVPPLEVIAGCPT